MCHRSQQSIERGKIINFMSADVNNIIQFLNPAMADIVVAPITIIVAVGLLWRVIGCAHSSVPSSLLRGHIASSNHTVCKGVDQPENETSGNSDKTSARC